MSDVQRFFIDTEFLERGPGEPIELISIGIVDDGDRAYYAVNADMPQAEVQRHPFLRSHVWPHLPLIGDAGDGTTTLDWRHETVKARAVIFAGVAGFLFRAVDKNTRIEIWADYGGFDYVVFSQLFGTMQHYPERLPMYFRDVQQLAAELDVNPDVLPDADDIGGVDHRAIDDARATRERWRVLTQLRQQQIATFRRQGATAMNEMCRRLAIALGYPTNRHGTVDDAPPPIELVAQVEARLASSA